MQGDQLVGTGEFQMRNHGGLDQGGGSGGAEKQRVGDVFEVELADRCC